jgi:cell division protein FtsB
MHLPNAAVAVEQKQTWQVLSGIRRAPRRAVPKAWWVGLAALVLGVLGLYVHTVQTEAALNKTQQDIRAMKQEATAMRAQLANLQNPRQVEAKATQALQMEAPREVVYMKTPTKVEAPAVNRIPPAPAMPHEGF